MKKILLGLFILFSLSVNAQLSGGSSSASTVQWVSTSANVTAAISTGYAVTTAASTIVVTLPTAVSQNGKDIVIKKVDAGAGTVSVVTTSSQTIDGQLSYSITLQFNMATFRSDGSNWLLVNVNTGVASEYGETNITAAGITVTTTATDLISFTLPSSGTWEVAYYGQVRLSITNQTGNLWISDNSNVVVLNSSTEYQTPSAFPTNTSVGTFSNVVRITTTGASTYKLRGQSNAQSFLVIGNTAGVITTTGGSKVIYKKISGFIPITGQSVDYVGVTQYSANTNTNISTITSANNTAFNTLLSTANRVILTGSTVQGNMTVTAVNGTITVAKTGAYHIVVTTSIQSAGTTGQWGQLVKNNATVLSANAAYSQASSAGMQIVLNYSGDFVAGDLIDVRLNSTAAGTIGITGYSYNVQQLGTSATIVTPISILQLDNTGATAQAGTIAAAGTGTGILWGASMFTKGSKISFTANSGTISLIGGVNGTTYRLTGKANSTGSTGNAYIFYRFYNVTTTLQIGSEGYTVDPDNGAGSGTGWDETSSPMSYAYITVPANTTHQIRLAVTASSATPGNLRQQSGQTSCTIEEIE